METVVIDAEVKSIDWFDEFTGSVDEPDFLLITACIGERGSEGADNFSVSVCNVAGLNKILEGQSGFWPRGELIVPKIDISHVEKTLQNLVQQFNGSKDWQTFSERLNRYLRWEFEDMDDFQGEPKIPEID